MAPSSKFASVNLNKSYGRQEGGASTARSRVHTHGGMVQFSRPLARPQPSGTKGLKLTVPRPMNLPSLRREISGNEASVPLHAIPGTSGWSKQNPADGGHPSISTNFDPPSSPQVHSSSRSPVVGGINAPSAKVVLLRGEDFPTLQASLSPAPQNELQHRQQEKMQYLKEQEIKLHKLPQDKEILSVQPLGPVKQSLNHHEFLAQRPVSGGYRKGNVSFLGPLVQLNHTSNWVDDERETLQSFRSQSDLSEHNRAGRKSDQNGEFVSQNGFLHGYARDAERNRYQSVFTLEHRHGQDNDGNDFISREMYTNRGLNGRYDNNDGAGWHGESKHDWISGKYFSSKADVNLKRTTSFVKDDNMWMKASGSVANRDGSPVRNFYRDGLVRQADSKLAHFQPEDLANADIISSTGSTRIGQHNGYSQREDVPSGISSSKERFVLNHEKNSFVKNKMKDSEKIYGKDKQRTYEEELSLQGTKPHSSLGMEHVNLDLKALRRKKDVTNEDKIWNTERKLFDEGLERVQKTLEQGNQKIAKEQERDAELRRKEHMVREQAAHEAEEHRLKLEQEAKEAALREEQQNLEATKKLEEERRARLEEKHRVTLEEERRKVAARRKLLELEERIAKREAEKKNEEQALEKDEDKMHEERQCANGTPLSVELRKLNNMAHEEQEHMFHFRNGPDHGKNECTSLKSSPLPYPSMREVPIEQNLQAKWLDRGPFLLGIKSGPDVLPGKAKTLPAWRKDTVDSGSGPVSTMPCDNSWHHEHLNRGFTPRDSLGIRNILPSLSKDSDIADNFTGKIQLPGSCNQDTEFSSECPPDIGFGHYDDFCKGEMEQSWKRNKRDWLPNGPHVASPPVPSYLQGTDFDSSSIGRSRQSLPKQPRVFPPPSRTPLQKHAFKVEINLSLTSTISDGADSDSHMGKDYLNENMQKLEPESVRMDVEEQVDSTQYDGHFSHDIQASEQEDTVILQLNSLVQPYNTSQSSEVDSQESITLGSPSLAEMRAESTFLEIVGKANEEDSNCCLEMLNEVFDSESAKDLADASRGEDDWAVEVGEEGLREADEEFSDYAYDGAVDQNLENQQLQFSKNDEDAVGSFLVKEYSDMVVVKQSYEQTFQDEAADNELQTSVLQTEVTNPIKAEQEIVEGVCLEKSITNVTGDSEDALQEITLHPIPQQSSFLTSNFHDSMQSREQDALTSNAIDSVQSTERDTSRQSFIQQFQQPFSFMTMPIPQSNSNNNAPQYSLGLTPIHGLQSHLDMPFQLQLGLLPGTTLLSNTIQIGSLHMPLHIQPQIPQFGHVHASQTPLFQFGQIGNSASLPQQIPMQIHHPLSQKMPPHLYQAHGVIEDSCQVISHATGQPKSQPFRQEEAVLAEVSTLEHVKLKSTTADSMEVLVAPRSDNQSELVDNVNLEQQPYQLHEKLLHGPADDAISRRAFEESLNGRNLRMSDMAGKLSQHIQDTVKPSGAHVVRIGGNGSGFSGWDPGNLCNGKTHRGFDLTSELGTHVEYNAAGNECGCNRSGSGHRNLCRSEYRVKESCSLQLASGGSQLTSSSTSTGFSDLEGVTDSLVQVAMADSDAGQNPEAVVVSHTGCRGDLLCTVNAPEQHTVAGFSGDAHSLKGNANVEFISDKSIQSVVSHILGLHGIEAPKAANDFIEVRPKGQVLNDQQELQANVNMEDPKDLKENEHILHKQRFHIRGDQQMDLNVPTSFISAASQVVECEPLLPKLSGESVSYGERSQHDHVFVSPTTSSRDTLQFLGPIGGIHANSLLGKSTEIGARGLVPSHTTSSMGVIFNDCDASRPVSCVMQDSSSSSAMTWGLQASSQEAVRLTQLHAERSVEPIYFGSSIPTQLHSPDKGTVVLQSETSVSTAHEKMTTTLSSPIGSLFSVDRIQFGAITPLTIIPPRSQPMPSIVFGSSLESREDGISDLKTELCARADDLRRHVALQVGAEAAASATAAICNNDSVGITHHSSLDKDSLMNVQISGKSFEKVASTASSLAIQTTRPAVQTPVLEDSVAFALPADLSVETSPLLFHGPLPQGSSSGFLFPPLPCGPSPFPYLEMGTILGGPIIAIGPREDALCISQGLGKTAPSVEPANPAVGAGVGGWQQYHSGGVIDSFYGGPVSAFPGPFVAPAPSLHAPPHMLLYANPFTPVGQYGQFGLGFMGPAYIPSGKLPDWKNVHMPTTSSLGSGANEEDRGNTGGLIIPHPARGGPVIMPVAPPLSPFDINRSAPFQVANADISMQPRWSHELSQHHCDLPVPGPVVVPAMQHCHYDGFQNQMETPPHAVQTNKVSVSMLAAKTPFQPMHAVDHLPNELGLIDTMSLNMSSFPGEEQNLPVSRGHVSTMGAVAVCGSPVSKVLRGRQSSHLLHGSTISGVTDRNFGTANLETNFESLERRPANGNPSSSKLPVQKLSHSVAPGQHSHATEQRGTFQQGTRRVGWFGSHGKGGNSGRLHISDRGSLGERTSSSSSKLKQVYVAKSSQLRNL